MKEEIIEVANASITGLLHIVNDPRVSKSHREKAKAAVKSLVVLSDRVEQNNANMARGLDRLEATLNKIEEAM
ncbi:MAG: hypothetical protein GY774_04775 [Planctomycetes bacterium]|nr:hypothetical protein [Planctomycetota bacterium]